MKTKIAYGLAAPLLVLGAALPACSDTEARERLKQNARATWDSAVDVTVEAAGLARARLEQELQDLQPRIDELRARTRELSGKAREEGERLLDDLENQRRFLRERLETIEEEGSSAWERMLGEAQSEIEGLSRRLDSALGRED